MENTVEKLFDAYRSEEPEFEEVSEREKILDGIHNKDDKLWLNEVLYNFSYNIAQQYFKAGFKTGLGIII